MEPQCVYIYIYMFHKHSRRPRARATPFYRLTNSHARARHLSAAWNSNGCFCCSKSHHTCMAATGFSAYDGIWISYAMEVRRRKDKYHSYINVISDAALLCVLDICEADGCDVECTLW